MIAAGDPARDSAAARDSATAGEPTTAGSATGATAARAATPVRAVRRRHRRRLLGRAVRSLILRHLRVDLAEGGAVDPGHRLLRGLLRLLPLLHLAQRVDAAPGQTERNGTSRGLAPAEPLRLLDHLARLTGGLARGVEIVAGHLEGVGAGLHPVGRGLADLPGLIRRFALPALVNDAGEVLGVVLAALPESLGEFDPRLRDLPDPALVDRLLVGLEDLRMGEAGPVHALADGGRVVAGDVQTGILLRELGLLLLRYLGRLFVMLLPLLFRSALPAKDPGTRVVECAEKSHHSPCLITLEVAKPFDRRSSSARRTGLPRNHASHR